MLLLVFSSKGLALFSFTNKNKSSAQNSVIFVHPDGMSLSHWDAVRLFKVGSKGLLNFDKLSHTGVYRGTIRGQVTATSNAGGTIHAYGIKTGKDSFGMDKNQPILSLSKKPYSVMVEAQKKGILVALVQSGVLVEPGTAAFISKIKNRKMQKELAAKQLIESNIDLLFAGGEKYLLPKGVQGHFGPGGREDKLNLIKWAKKKGYTVIYNFKRFKSIQSKAKKILGIFAHEDTYNDEPPSFFKNRKDYYIKKAPTIAEMTRRALSFLESKKRAYFIVIEEEGTDNFSNLNNTRGFLEAGMRSDDAIGVARKFIKRQPHTLLITTSDSNAGALTITNPKILPNQEIFYSNKRRGAVYPFSILWPTTKDVHGGVLVKAEGLNAHKVKGIVENTDIYKIIYQTLFQKTP